jgi:DNA-directed RNA polymerase subunit RPC12/RpoP
MAERHRINLRLQHADNLLAAERFEDAAKIYESLNMWKEAGETRRHGKRNVVTQVQVDVNDLIDQVRRGGLTTTYSCPACRSPIQIDANMDVRALKHCQHCGSVIQSTDLVEFLSRVVGYR